MDADTSTSQIPTMFRQLIMHDCTKRKSFFYIQKNPFFFFIPVIGNFLSFEHLSKKSVDAIYVVNDPVSYHLLCVME